ncbi:MAG: PLD nuclease N-terminal domain-containing protein [Gemmatimonadota bacterium]
MRAGLALIVFIINVAAIVSILGARDATRRKRAWCAAVVLLPIVGAVGWLTLGKR